jgi:hypothetical protein
VNKIKKHCNSQDRGGFLIKKQLRSTHFSAHQRAEVHKSQAKGAAEGANLINQGAKGWKKGRQWPACRAIGWLFWRRKGAFAPKKGA